MCPVEQDLDPKSAGCRLPPPPPQTLTNVDDIKRYFVMLEEEEAKMEEELRTKRAACAAVPLVDAALVRVVADMEAFAPRVRAAASSTVTEAESVIAKTRMLDAAHSRVQQVRGRACRVVRAWGATHRPGPGKHATGRKCSMR